MSFKTGATTSASGPVLELKPIVNDPPMAPISFNRSAVLGSLEMLSKSVIPSHPSFKGNNVSDIETKTRFLSAALEALKTVVATHIARNLRNRNALASHALQLPNEILSTILQFVHHNESSSWKVISTLKLVCNRFNQLVEATPAIWGYIMVGASPPGRMADSTRIQLSKSRNAALRIFIDTPLPYKEQEAMFHMICSHMRRWQYIELNLWPRGRLEGSSNVAMDLLLTPLIENNCPLLQTFKIKYHGDPAFYSVPLNLFQGHAPRLRHFSAPSINISWNNPILSGLTSLDITAWDGFQTPSAEQYKRLLGSSPELEMLTIRGHVGRVTSYIAPFSLQFHLPKLKVLLLISVDPRIIRSILSSSMNGLPEFIMIKLPRLHADDEIGDVNELLKNPPEGSLLSRIFYASSDVSIYAKGRLSLPRISTRFEGPDGSLITFHCQAQELESPILFVQPFVSRSYHILARIRKLTINWDVPVCPELYPSHQLFAELSELEELRLTSATKWLEEAMQLLSIPTYEPSTDSHSSLTWLCPGLQRLWIDNEDEECDHMPLVHKFVAGRYQHPSGLHPTRLSLLNILGTSQAHDLHDMDAEDIAVKIAEVIGRGVLNWKGHRLNASGQWESV